MTLCVVEPLILANNGSLQKPKSASWWPWSMGTLSHWVAGLWDQHPKPACSPHPGCNASVKIPWQVGHLDSSNAAASGDVDGSPWLRCGFLKTWEYVTRLDKSDRYILRFVHVAPKHIWICSNSTFESRSQRMWNVPTWPQSTQALIPAARFGTSPAKDRSLLGFQPWRSKIQITRRLQNALRCSF